MTTRTELEEAFRLRFEVYSGSESNVFITTNSSGPDLNYFDISSMHFAIKTGGRIIRIYENGIATA